MPRRPSNPVPIQLPSGQKTLLEVLREHVGLLDAKDVARLIRCSPKHAYTLMNKRAIPVIPGTKLVDPKVWAWKIANADSLMKQISKIKGYAA